MDEIIPNTALLLEHIPQPQALWHDINIFAHSFDGYTEAGSFERCAAIAQKASPDSLTEARICLFFEARSWRHGGEEPDAGELVYLQTLVRDIRDFVTRGDLR